MAPGIERFVVVYSSTRPRAFDSRLLFMRLASDGTPLADPIRIDDEEVHQDYPSITGYGCELAVSYILGNPNGEVRVGLVRGL